MILVKDSPMWGQKHWR